MRKLIDDLLTFSRISRFDKKFITTDLNKVLKDVLCDFDLLVQEKNAVLHLDKLPVIPAVRGNNCLPVSLNHSEDYLLPCCC